MERLILEIKIDLFMKWLHLDSNDNVVVVLEPD